MAFKAFLFLMATSLFVITEASSHDLHKELKIKAAYLQSKGPSLLPIIKAPAPPPLVTKAPAPPPKVATPSPPLPKPPVTPVVKPPTYSPPPPKVIKSPPPQVKPPVVAPVPQVKPPTTPVPPLVKPPVTAPPVKPPTYSAPPLPPVKSNKDCVPLCEIRCSLHSRKRVCMRACTTCCERCKCVPPGTSGNRERCGTCYTGMKTHGDRPKCP